MKNRMSERKKAAGMLLLFLFTLSQGFTWDLVTIISKQNSLCYLFFQCWGMLFFAYTTVTIDRDNYLRKYVIAHPTLLKAVKLIVIKITMIAVSAIELLYVAPFILGKSESGVESVNQTKKKFLSEYKLYSWDLKTVLAVMISTMIVSAIAIIVYSYVDRQHIYKNSFINFIAAVAGMFALTGVIAAIDESKF